LIGQWSCLNETFTYRLGEVFSQQINEQVFLLNLEKNFGADLCFRFRHKLKNRLIPTHSNSEK